MADPGEKPRLTRLWNWWVKSHAIRWGAAALLVVAALVVTVWVEPTVCRDQLSQVGDRAVVAVCGPIAVTDPPALVGLLLLFFLLAPDLTEVSIGVLTLKQRADAAEAQQTKLSWPYSSRHSSRTQPRPSPCAPSNSTWRR